MLTLYPLLCLFFFMSLYSCKKVKFVKDDKDPSCVFNFLDDSFNSMDKKKFTPGTKYKNDQSKMKICCTKQSKTEVMFEVSGRSTTECCVLPQNNDDYENSRTRPCAGYTYLTRFLEKGSNYERTNSQEAPPYHKLKCPIYGKRSSKSFRADKPGDKMKRIVAYTDSKNNCKDLSKKFQVKFYYLATDLKRYLYSWCCAKDIFSDYSVDPQTECCGLSGAASPYYSSINDKNGIVMRDNPDCCRSQANKPLCEPMTLYQDKFISHPCPPLSGLASITPNLNEDIPNFAPAYYGFAKGSTKNTDLFIDSRCKLTTYPFFYTFRNVRDDYTNGHFKGQYGLCCKRQNMFAESAASMATECCIAYTTNLDTAKSDPLPCDPYKGGIRGESLFYKPCQKNACKKNKVLGTAKKFRITFTVTKIWNGKSVKLYGSDVYFWEKHTYDLKGPVNLDKLAFASLDSDYHSTFGAGFVIG